MRLFYVNLVLVCLFLFFFPAGCKRSTGDRKDDGSGGDLERLIMPDDNLAVRFAYRGEIVDIQGRKLNDSTFIYNEGAEKKIWITTLEWAPYIGKHICKQGWVQQLTIALLVIKGYEVKSTFYPWTRSVKAAETGNAAVLYPEYFIEENAPSDIFEGTKRVEHLALSKRIPGGQVAFFKRTDDTIGFTGDLESLAGEKIGVVQGYQNTPEFDKLMDSGFFQISTATTDMQNVLKLYNKRINLIIGDPEVIFYNIRNSSLDEKKKKLILDGIEIVQPPLQYNYLYYGVSKKREGWETLLDDINASIDELTESGELFRIITRTTDYCKHKMEKTLEPYQE